MSYSLHCECGASIAVSAAQAGATAPCACGRTIDVPLLSQLRKSAGESPIPLNTVETIRAMVRSGELPENGFCPHSGLPANATLCLTVQCESKWVRGGDAWDFDKIVTFFLLLGWLGVLIASFRSRPREELGRNTYVELPVRISADVAQELVHTRRRNTLRKLLLDTPLYVKLLEEFPQATVVAARLG